MAILEEELKQTLYLDSRIRRAARRKSLTDVAENWTDLLDCLRDRNIAAMD